MYKGKKEEAKVGDILTVEFVKNQRKGKKPIAMHNGMICFIDRGYRGDFISEHSIWQAEVLQVKDRVLVIDPIQIIKSAAVNNMEIGIRTKELGEKFAKQFPTKEKKEKCHYPYKSGQERK